MSIFLELSIILIVAVCISFVMRFLKQPLVVGYILSGILLGPYFFNIIESIEHIEVFSKIGISILLFIVGLSLSPHIIKEVGKVSFVTGLGQVVFTSVIGFFICLALGLAVVPAILVSLALTLSSTIIILKLLSDKGDLTKLYGKVALGLLLVQDVVATIILMVISTLGAHQTTDNSIGFHILFLVVQGVLLTVFLYLLSTKVVSKFTSFIASNQEFLFIFSLAWGFGISSIFAFVGFSIEIGALIAGVTLAASPFAYEISSRLKPLRDFFVLLFFILLGVSLVVTDASSLVFNGVMLSLFVLIGNPIIVFVLMYMLRFKHKTSFQTGLTVAQISEFSLILMALAHSFGFITTEVLSLVTVVGMITIAGSSYLIMYSDKLFYICEPFIKKIFPTKTRVRSEHNTDLKYDVVLFGFGRVGMDFVKVFQSIHKTFLIVDFNPATLKDLKQRNIPHRFGDAEDVEFLDELNLTNTSLVVSTIPDFDTNMLLVTYTKGKNPDAVVILLSHDSKEADVLYEAGATYVAVPHYIGAKHIGDMIKKSVFDQSSYEKHRARHLLAIKTRYFL